LQPIADLLGTDVATVLTVLNSWGPGKFDAELLMDGKAFRPDGKSAATLIPPAKPWQRFLAAFDGSSCRDDTPSVGAPGATGRPKSGNFLEGGQDYFLDMFV